MTSIIVNAASRAGFALLAATALPAAGVAAADLVSHQAVYRMTLAEADPQSGVLGADGVLLFRFADRCDGWTSEMSTDVAIDYGEGGESRSRWTFASWEAADGLAFRFRSRETVDGEEPSLLEGSASLSGPGESGTASFTRPETATVALPAGTQFPTHHLLAMLGAARRGQKFLSSPLFDGSSLDNPYTVSAVVVPLDEAERRRAAAAAGLPPRLAWDFAMAFFSQASPDGTPDFALTVRYGEDGVADRLVEDYGDFTLLLTLEQFDLLDGPACSP